MRVAVVLLSTFAVALCAPTGENADALEIDGDDMRVKRAKEVMMYGNQQNEQQSNVKRASPSDNSDENGYIVANEATNLETEDSQESSNVAEEMTENNDEINESNIEDNTEIEQQESQETEKAEQDSEESVEDVPETSTALEPVVEDNDENDDEMSVEEYLKELEELQDEGSDENIAPYLDSLLKDTTYPYWNQLAYRDYNNYNAPYNNYQRYKRSQVRTMKNMKFPMLKRSHRVKRQAYYLPDVDGYLPYDDRFLDTPYNNYPVTEEDLAELLDVLDDPKPYEEDAYVNPYEEYPPYEEANDIEFESPIYMPKRQSGLSFVPGIKRNRDFYPYFKEPASHFQAFVPSKRSLREEAEAYNAYERVMALAAALRQQNYYPGEYIEGYRRRK